jgi:hypothetical protein
MGLKYFIYWITRHFRKPDITIDLNEPQDIKVQLKAIAKTLGIPIHYAWPPELWDMRTEEEKQHENV